jgi:hypothetical protein
MDFQLALALLKAFSAYNPKIYKQFAGFPDTGNQESEGGYVAFVDSDASMQSFFSKLEDFARANGLKIVPIGKSLMVTS